MPVGGFRYLTSLLKFWNRKDSATKMFEYYEESRKPRGRVWKDGRGNTVKNWKQKARSVWFKPDNLKSNQEYDFKNFDNVIYP